jgi:hypothetical protein
MSEWTLTYDVRPWTLNNERKLHHMTRAKIVKEWRQAYCELAQKAMMPAMSAVEVVAQPYVLNARYRQDVGACFPAVKAAIDGVVDAGVLIDDNAKIVLKLSFLAPLMGHDALEVTFIEVK